MDFCKDIPKHRKTIENQREQCLQVILLKKNIMKQFNQTNPPFAERDQGKRRRL
jgi:hypothetical protein